MTYSDEFLEKTLKVWQPYSKEPLTKEDAREICVNMSSLAKLLIELDKKYNVVGKSKVQ
jgi:hypothetical protein